LPRSADVAPLAQEASNFVGDELARGHDRHMPLAGQNRNSRVRDDVPNPLGTFALPVGALLAEQGQHRGCEILEAPGMSSPICSNIGSDASIASRLSRAGAKTLNDLKH
jgi:hypothetical protein